MTDETTWWGEGEPEGTSWKTGSSAKKARMAKYIEWLLTPRSKRQPRTKKDLAAELGVTTATLRNYTKDPWLQRELAEKARAEAKVDRVPEILQSLYDQALDVENPRSVAAAKTYLQWLKDTEEARVPDDFGEMSDKDLEELTKELLHRISRKEMA